MKHFEKRIIALVLTVVMVLGSLSVVSAAGRVADGSTGWNTSDVDNYTVSATSSVTVTFNNTPFVRDTNNWSNFIIETVSSDEADGITLRADAYGWTYGSSAVTPTYVATVSFDWDDFQTICTENSKVTVTASYTSDTTLTFVIVWGDDVATETYVVTYSTLPDSVQFHVGTDGGIVEVTSVEYSGTGLVADGSTGWNTSDVDNYTVTADTSVSVTFDNTPFQRDSDNWSNFIIETVSTADTNGLTVRADAYGWTYGTASVTPTYDVSYTFDWADFQTICTENSEVTLTVAYTGENTVTFVIVWGDGAATETYTVTYDTLPDSISFHVGTDGGIVAAKSVSYSVINFLGGSLRMDYDGYDQTSLRFGYSLELPAGASIESATWAWGTDSANLNQFTPSELKYVVNSDGTVTTNLVVTGVPASYYDSAIYSQITVTYTLADGTTVTETEYTVQSRTVDDVATAILASDTAGEDEMAYAQGILNN